MRMKIVVALLSLMMASTLLADAKVTQKTQVQFGGVIGAAANVFGGKAVKEGITSDVAVKKNRRIARTGDSAEIVDLDEEKIYHVDYARKTYKVTTFAELRKQFEEAMKDTNEEQSKGEKGKKDPNAKEYEVDFDVKNTGAREKINGFDAKQTIATVTIREKGKKLEEAGGSVLTADLWMAPRVAAMREVEEFERRYLKKLWGDTGMDIRSMAALMALAPDMSKAMKKLQENQAKMDGSAVRSIVTFEAVPDPRQSAQSAESEDAGSAAVQALGGLMRRMKKKPAEETEQPAAKTAATTKGGKMLFRSNSEVLNASAAASADEVAIPAGFTLKK